MCIIGEYEYDTIITTGAAEEIESGEEGVEDFGMEDEDVAEEAEELSGDGEEARVARARRAPRGPTQIERELH